MPLERLPLFDHIKDTFSNLVLFGMTVQERSLIEQHIGTILQLAVVGLLGWSLNTTYDMSVDLGTLKKQVSMMEATIGQGTTDRYRGADAARDQAAIWSDLQRKENRLTQLEEALTRHRAEVAGMSGRKEK